MSDATLNFQPSAAVLAEQTQLQIPSNLDWIEPTVEHLKTQTVLSGVCEEAQAGRLFLALHEALTNAIVHGNLEVASQLKEVDDTLFARTLAERLVDPAYSSRLVHISIDYDGERCSWALTDQGPGFDYQTVLKRQDTEEEEPWAVSGRGIKLMRALVDEVRYEGGGRRVILTLHRANRPEKREHPRWPLHQRVHVAPIRPDGSVDWAAAYETVTQNLSAGGLGLLQSQLSQAERVLIGMDYQGQTVYLPAQVRHCQTVQGNIIELGCRFLLEGGEVAEAEPQAPNVEATIEGLLAMLQNQPAVDDERRENRRVSYTEQIEVLSPDGGPPLIGYARDISRGGIAFIAPDAIPLEKQILCLPRGGKPLRVRVRIVRCLPIALGFYDVAARFEELV